MFGVFLVFLVPCCTPLNVFTLFFVVCCVYWPQAKCWFWPQLKMTAAAVWVVGKAKQGFCICCIFGFSCVFGEICYICILSVHFGQSWRWKTDSNSCLGCGKSLAMVPGSSLMYLLHLLFCCWYFSSVQSWPQFRIALTWKQPLLDLSEKMFHVPNCIFIYLMYVMFCWWYM